ncbi:MAG TPA: hypothetical protein VNR67_07715 [Solirubrobacterales bacterium]|nr:hypothetical protein [Solirubrobacterales bacterium]
MRREAALEWESRWAVPVAMATFAAVVLIIVSLFVGNVSGSGDAEVLRSVDANSGSALLSGLMRAVAFALLAFPLVYLFRADRARSDRVRTQLIGLVVAAPLFLGLSSGFAVVAQREAADEFVSGEAKSTLTQKEAKEECVGERKDDGNDFLVDEYEPAGGESPLGACETRKREDDAASNAQTEASFTPFATGLGIAGGLGFVVALFYSCLWAMRTGLLTRFWGSLGMALGVAALFGLMPFVLLWFLYFGVLLLDRLPGGRPPAWAAGEAIPWPTPGEKAAAELEPEGGWEESDPAGPGEGDEGDSGPKRKRKRRE